MPAKKKDASARNTYEVDVAKFSLGKEKYVDNLSQFLQEHVQDCKCEKSGNVLKLSTPANITKRMVRLRLERFIYQAGLKNSYRAIAKAGNPSAYQIMDR